MLSAISREAARRFGDRPVVVAPDGTLSYAELDLHADALATGLAQRGVTEGDIVVLALAPGCDWLVAAVAVARLGAAFAGVSTAITASERHDLVDLIHPRLVLAQQETVDGLPLRVDVAVLDPGGRGAPLATDGEPPTDPAPDDERLAAICFTSGTTGRAKAAVFRERQLRAVQLIDLGPEAEQTWGGGSSMLASTQFAHVGMTTKFPWYLRVGATLHVMQRWRADDALELVARERMPTIGAVAPQLALMLRSPLMDQLDLSCVMGIIAGGAPSPPALVEEARRRFGAGYSIRYSSTESGGVGLGTAFDAPDQEALHTVGRPRPGVEVRIADEQDDELPRNEVGELQLRSAAVMDGYLGDPDATAAALTQDGWLRTGDLALINDDGCVELRGRRTDMYIRGGYNVFPQEVEAVLLDHPSVADVAVTPLADDVLGEIGVALVVPTDPADPPSIDDLRSHCDGRLARYKWPEKLTIVSAIPLTTAQKVDRRAAAELVIG